MKVAIVGCGWAGIRHARAFTECGAEIAWAVDTDEKRAEKVRRIQNSGRIAAEYKEAIADADLAAVDICLPHDLHAPVAIDCLGAGKHVLVEKPIAATLEEAEAMIQAAAKAGVVLMVAENEVYSPLYRRVRDLIADGIIGKPALVQMTRGAYATEDYKQNRPWFLDEKRAAGGMMMSGGIHDVEKLRMIIGEISAVQALQAPRRCPEMGADDTGIAVLRFENGAIGTMIQSNSYKNAITAAGEEIHRLRIDGQLGSIEAIGTHGGRICIFSEKEDLVSEGSYVETEIVVPEQDTFYLEIAHFLHCLERGETPITAGNKMRRSLEIILGAYKSMENGGALVPLE
ncbi:MAG: Gfo/Idh/MocA family oxidoreductase [Spirochaetaceae bacterium]|nr:MAG: Gfo/Idh/MocA family oxidoreductase [Spirochaetaceae bacterium]